VVSNRRNVPSVNPATICLPLGVSDKDVHSSLIGKDIGTDDWDDGNGDDDDNVDNLMGVIVLESVGLDALVFCGCNLVNVENESCLDMDLGVYVIALVLAFDVGVTAVAAADDDNADSPCFRLGVSCEIFFLFFLRCFCFSPRSRSRVMPLITLPLTLP